MVRDYSEGALSRTGNPLDLGIKGKGWFAVETPLGTRYTRNGQFTLNADGEVVTSNGHRVLSENDTPVVIDPGTTKIEVTGDGTVKAGEIATKLKLVEFEDESVLRKTANTLYRTEVEVDPPDAANAKVVQGALESSNVEAILEITDMIQTMRDYQSTQKIIDEEHNRQRSAVQTLLEEK
jgi:flagellar basal-body rod protein FlgF